MILQRLAQSIRKQDWFAVAVETLIVVLGVFLGIQLVEKMERLAELGMAKLSEIEADTK